MIARVKSRRDKKFCHAIASFGMTYFFPAQEMKVNHARSQVDRLIPILKGFVFFLGDDLDFYRAKSTRHCFSVIVPKNQPEILRDLRNLARAVKDLQFDRWQVFEPGKPVIVKSTHPTLGGLEGQVCSQDKNRVRLNVHMMGTAVFHIDSKWLKEKSNDSGTH